MDSPAEVQATAASAERRMRRRVQRLGYVSLVALGLVWLLAVAALRIPAFISAALLAGWLLMPYTLFASLANPQLRYGLVLPSALVGLALVGICAFWLPDAQPAATGWLLLTVGVLLGAALGAWFWYSWLPVPHALVDPEAPGRWFLIAVHVGLIVLGWGLAATALFA